MMKEKEKNFMPTFFLDCFNFCKFVHSVSTLLNICPALSESEIFSLTILIFSFNSRLYSLSFSETLFEINTIFLYYLHNFWYSYHLYYFRCLEKISKSYLRIRCQFHNS